MRKSTITLSFFAIAALMILMASFQSSVVAQRGGRPAPNDECVDAVEVGTLSRTFFDTIAATTASTDPCISCCFFGVGQNANSIWYVMDVKRDGSIIRASTRGSDYDTVLAIWQTDTGDCPTGSFNGGCSNDAGVTEVACNDDASSSLQSELTIVANSGDRLFFEVAECTGTAPGFGGLAVVSISQSLR